MSEKECLYVNDDPNCDGSLREVLAGRKLTKIGWVLETTELCRYHHTHKVVESGYEPYETHAKLERNKPCPCGSEKKYKKCHG